MNNSLVPANQPEVTQVKNFIGDDIPNAVYINAPLQWKIGAKREIKEPYLACKEEAFEKLCQFIGYTPARVEVSVKRVKYIVFELDVQCFRRSRLNQG
jgi:hypothetical protein